MFCFVLFYFVSVHPKAPESSEASSGAYGVVVNGVVDMSSTTLTGHEVRSLRELIISHPYAHHGASNPHTGAQRDASSAAEPLPYPPVSECVSLVGRCALSQKCGKLWCGVWSDTCGVV